MNLLKYIINLTIEFQINKFQMILIIKTIKIIRYKKYIVDEFRNENKLRQMNLEMKINQDRKVQVIKLYRYQKILLLKDIGRQFMLCAQVIIL